MAEKVAMIGLDAAEWWLVEKYIEEGLMPHLDKLRSASRFVKLDAAKAFKAEGRWTEVLTGRSLEENQYWSIVDFDPTTYSSWYSRSCHGTYFYARPDLRSIVFDIPNSIVVEDVHGIQVTAWGSHAPQFPSGSRPTSVLGQIDRKFGVHEGMLTDGHTGWHNDTYLDNLQRTMVKGIHQRVDISRWLREQEPDWDLFVTVFAESHVGEHQYLHGLLPDHPLYGTDLAGRAADRMREIFAELDIAVGDMVAEFDDDTTIVVFAGHGMMTNASDVTGAVLIPELLHRMAFGEPMIDFDPFDPDQPFVELDQESLPRHWLEARLRRPTPVTTSGLRSLPKKLVRRIRHHLPETWLNKFEKVYWKRPDWWEMNVRPITPLHTRDLYAEASRIELESVAAASWYRPYWSQMRSFVIPSFSDCHIRINLKGREADGIVDFDDYDAECAAVEAELRALVNPRTGTPIVKEVLRVRADDPLAEIGPAPDLLVTFNETADTIQHPEHGLVGPCPLMRAGEHTPNGWAIISTPDGESGDLGVIEPRDLTATVIDLLDVPESPLVTGTSALASSE
ncbi:MAG: alkaline phosphatase family protein [Actinomycetota bacterium]